MYPAAVRGLTADVFHVLDQSYGHLLRHLPAERSVVTCHDLTPFRIANGDLMIEMPRMAMARFRFAANALPKADRIVCVSDTTRSDVLRFLSVDPEKVVVIPPGIDPRFRPLPSSARAELRDRFAGGDSGLLLQVDSGMPYKNNEGVIRTLAAIHRAGRPATLLRVGPRLRPASMGLAEDLGVADSIIELGSVPDERLVQLYNLAHLLLFPSLHEGFGWPALEAMACETPVVVSSCLALMELVGDAGLSAPAEDADALARLALLVLEEPETAQSIAARGRARAELFGWRRTAAAYGEIYASLGVR